MKTYIKVLHWTPRIICILAIIFISLFALDSFSPDLTIWQQIGDFLMHMIPSFVLLIILIIAWKWEFWGGIIFALIGLGFSPFIFMHNFKMNQSVWHSISTVLIINIPFVIVGLLFIISHNGLAVVVIMANVLTFSPVFLYISQPHIPAIEKDLCLPLI